MGTAHSIAANGTTTTINSATCSRIGLRLSSMIRSRLTKVTTPVGHAQSKTAGFASADPQSVALEALKLPHQGQRLTYTGGHGLRRLQRSRVPNSWQDLNLDVRVRQKRSHRPRIT